jgi:hypothetical protein
MSKQKGFPADEISISYGSPLSSAFDTNNRASYSTAASFDDHLADICQGNVSSLLRMLQSGPSVSSKSTVERPHSSREYLQRRGSRH